MKQTKKPPSKKLPKHGTGEHNMDEKKEHQALLEEWQERLGLHDWRITLNDNCHPDDMSMKNCVGCTD